jgi:hypothetical protein
VGHHAIVPSAQAVFDNGAPADGAGATQGGTVTLSGSNIVIQGNGTTMGTASPLTLPVSALAEMRSLRTRYAAVGKGFTSADIVDAPGTEATDATMGILEDSTSSTSGGQPVRVELRGPSPALAMSLDTFDALLLAAADLGV